MNAYMPYQLFGSGVDIGVLLMVLLLFVSVAFDFLNLKHLFLPFFVHGGIRDML